jgi:hypothetical protein
VTEAEREHAAILSAANSRLAEAEAVVAELGRSIAAIERERRRVRPSDWDTLFRQMGDVLQHLASHPFIAGDLHAEMLIRRLAGAADLPDLDTRVDVLGEYIAGKLAFQAALIAAREGREPDPADLLPRQFGGQAPGAGRALAQQGPSGSDFQITDNDKLPPPQRSVFRL